uniref:DUF47 family protein n=1 Tax=Candidatus Methanophaga sp. ANME-1 ERB7 TaxID=2759913 RepID=A0A7G9Z4Q2_9EURY|nr:hypothetical protein MHJDHPNH_00038 [Methanosarcinales archaeon ANME-1 ERB7]
MIYEKNISLLREKKFFSLFENLAGKAVEAAELLMELKEDSSKLPQISQELNRLEDEADSVVHQIAEELIYDHSREGEEKADIRYFAHNLDNVVDGVEKAVNRLTFTRLEPKTIPEPVGEFSTVILKASQEIRKAVSCLRNLSTEERTIEACCIRINELENEADKINRKWLRILMTTPVEDPNALLERMVLKEIVDILEDTMDQCEDVANILDTFRVKKLFFYYENCF